MTEIQQHTMSRDDAERLTERIRLTAVSFMETRDKLARYVREAQEGRAHEALGYRSWTEYIAQVFSDTPLMRLTRDERRVIVADLSEQGMSSRAIAPVVGASDRQIRRDLTGGTDVPPASPATPAEPTFDPTPSWDPATGEITDAPEPRPVTGLDGKTYTRPEPQEDHTPRKPKRRPIHETARDAGMNLRDAVDRIARIFEDDRFNPETNELAPQLRNQLIYAIETCQGLTDRIPPKE